MSATNSDILAENVLPLPVICVNKLAICPWTALNDSPSPPPHRSESETTPDKTPTTSTEMEQDSNPVQPAPNNNYPLKLLHRPTMPLLLLRPRFKLVLKRCKAHNFEPSKATHV